MLKGRRLTPAECNQLAERELAFVKDHDSNTAKIWYMIDTRWLHQWKTFVKQRGAAGQVPCEVDNSRLVDPRSGAPRPGLQLTVDYRGINATMWKHFVELYGGEGPEIVRGQLDIYSEPLGGGYEFRSASKYGYGSSRGSGYPDSRSSGYGDSRGSAFADSHSSGYGDSRSDSRRGSTTTTSTKTSTPRSLSFGALRHLTRSSNSSNRGASTMKQGHQSQNQQQRCEKCDGPHPSSACPHFKKPREQHPDAWALVDKSKDGMGGQGFDAAPPIIRNARVVSQPGDGSCLFHSLSYGLGDGTSASSLREEICEFISRNANMPISGTPLKEWIRWDSGGSIQSYVNRMRRRGEWGGGIEMAALAHLRRVNIHVYEAARGGGFARISTFNGPPSASKTINVIYQGGMHYDALAGVS